MMPIFIILWTGDGANKLFNNCDDWLLTIDMMRTQYAVIDTELETENRVNYGSAKGSTENHYGHIDWVLCLKILLYWFLTIIVLMKIMIVKKFLLKQQIKNHLAPAKEVPGVQVGNIAVRLLCELKQASCQPRQKNETQQ